MKNLSKRDQKARQKATPGWDDRIAEYDLRLNYGGKRDRGAESDSQSMA
jgi:hypothetical protein